MVYYLMFAIGAFICLLFLDLLPEVINQYKKWFHKGDKKVMFPSSISLFVRPVKEGLILWSDYYGFIEVWTQGKGFGDLVYQFGIQCPIEENPLDFIMNDYHNGVLTFEGDD